MFTSLSQIPVTDLDRLRHGNPAAKRTVARHLHQAWQEVGIVYVHNHGISQSLIEQTFAQSKTFFDLPLELKQRLAWSEGSYTSKTGYIGIEQECLDADQPGDPKEGLDLGHEGLATGDWAMLPAGFHETMVEFYRACAEVANWLLRAIELSLGLPECSLVEKHSQQEHELLLLHYPPLKQAPKPGQFRAGEHTDYGTISLIFQDDTGGLEFQTKAGNWIAVPAVPGRIVVNIADLLQRWTNDTFISSKHRVVSSSETACRSRYSVVFFCNPNRNLEIACLETCQNPDNPPRYPPVVAGDYIEGLLRSTISS